MRALLLACAVLLLGPACSSGPEDALPPEGPDAAADSPSDQAAEAAHCAPGSCDSLGASCGSVPDGCGGVLSCGDCPAGEFCGGGGANKCGVEPCSSPTCAQLGIVCGLRSDGCGGVQDCGTCVLPNATAACGDTACLLESCAASHGNCDGVDSNGCEADLSTDPSHCGTCGILCPIAPHASPVCVAGACSLQCEGSFANCDGHPSNGCEIDTASNTSHCGSCDHACSLANSVAGCKAGNCAVATCNTGFADCNAQASDGCETSISDTAGHCGGCGKACPAEASCREGICRLPWSFSHWRVDQPATGCPEWGKIAEIRFRVGGSLAVNAATGYASGTAGGQSIVQISHSGDSAAYGLAWKAFDGTTTEAWQKYSDASYYFTGSEYIVLKVASPIKTDLVQVGGFWGSTRCVRLSGSNDGANWTVLGSACNTNCDATVSFVP